MSILIWQFSTLKMIWIFLFVVNCIVTFLMAMYNNDIEELKRCILPDRAQVDADQEQKVNNDRYNVQPYKNKQTLEEQLQVLMEKLCYAERLIKNEIKNGEKILSNTESNTLVHRDLYKSLMVELKKDIHKTEEEVKGLQDKVSSLCVRRIGLKNEVVKQQQDYQKMLNTIDKELERKDVACVTS